MRRCAEMVPRLMSEGKRRGPTSFYAIYPLFIIVFAVSVVATAIASVARQPHAAS